MSFSVSSLFVLLLVIGELTSFQGEGLPPQMRTVPEVESSLSRSCQVLLSQGPLAGLEVDKLIEFQRQSLERFKRRRQEFIAMSCQKQQGQFLRDHFMRELLSPRTPSNPLPFGLGLFHLNAEDVQIAGQEPPTSARVPRRPQTESFICDQGQAEAEFAQQFGHGTNNPLEEQLKIFPGLDVEQMIAFWDAFCVEGSLASPPDFIDYAQLAKSYNQLLSEANQASLDPVRQVSRWPQAKILDDQGEPLGSFMRSGRPVTYTPLSEIPQLIQKAFIAAEDKNFLTHRGVEFQGILRGFLKYMRDGSIEGGSTITQQLVKNLILNNELSLDRKAKEMLLARKLEDSFTKSEILEVYLNIIYLGRGSRGVRSAVDRYFGPQVSLEQISLAQASFLAGITHSPNRYNPSLVSAETIGRRQTYVLDEMLKAGHISEEEKAEALADSLNFTPLRFARGSYFLAAASEEFANQISRDGSQGLTEVHSTQNRSLQEGVDALLQAQLSRFERRSGQILWQGPLRNIAYLWQREGGDSDPLSSPEIWQDELIKTQSLFAGVQWPVAVVLKPAPDWTIGVLSEGIGVLQTLRAGDLGGGQGEAIRNQLQIGDVVFVEPMATGFFLRVPPVVQGAVVVMDVQTGEVKALSGGFDYSLTPFDRARLAQRQPGSTIKPFVYLSALDAGLRPESRISNAAIEFPATPGCGPWTPNNYSSVTTATTSLEEGLVRSLNRTTAHLLEQIASSPRQSLEELYQGLVILGLYDPNPLQGSPCFPLILGSQETSLLNLATAYASLANGGWRVAPHFLKMGEAPQPTPITHMRRQAYVDLTAMLSQVVARGTGSALREHRGKVAGKTGTSSDYRDAWFVGYSNQHVVVAWMGYDQSVQRVGNRIYNLSLGGQTGGRLVAPMVNEIFRLLFEPVSGQALDGGSPLISRSDDYALADPQAGLDDIEVLVLPEMLATESGSPELLPSSEPLGDSVPEGEHADQEPSLELKELLHEDSWQRMRDRRRNLLQGTQGNE